MWWLTKYCHSMLVICSRNRNSKILLDLNSAFCGWWLPRTEFIYYAAYRDISYGLYAVILEFIVKETFHVSSMILPTGPISIHIESISQRLLFAFHPMQPRPINIICSAWLMAVQVILQSVIVRYLHRSTEKLEIPSRQLLLLKMQNYVPRLA